MRATVDCSTCKARRRVARNSAAHCATSGERALATLWILCRAWNFPPRAFSKPLPFPVAALSALNRWSLEQSANTRPRTAGTDRLSISFRSSRTLIASTRRQAKRSTSGAVFVDSELQTQRRVFTCYAELANVSEICRRLYAARTTSAAASRRLVEDSRSLDNARRGGRTKGYQEPE